MLRLIKSYLKYTLVELVFLIKLTIYLPTHLRHFWSVIKFSRRDKDICLNNRIPWMTYPAIDWIKQHIKDDMNIFELGSGGSTLFFADYSCRVVSIEHDPEWYRKISSYIDNKQTISYHLHTDKDDYSKSIRTFTNNSFDFIIIDGIQRDDCLIEAIPKIKPGGSIIFDNSDLLEYKHSFLSFKGWERLDFTGPGPYNHYFWTTSILIKPKNI